MLPGALLRRVGEAYCAGRVGAGTVELRSSMRGERRLGAMGDGESRAKPSAPRISTGSPQRLLCGFTLVFVVQFNVFVSSMHR